MGNKKAVINKVATMKRAVLSAAFIFMVTPCFPQITLECDYASSTNSRGPMHYHWDVSNRISPMGRMNMPVGENPYITVVRPLGGKSRNDQKLIEEDTYKWDGSNYFYDWAPLKKQIDTVLVKARLFQLMIDNPPWAFQRGIDLKGGKEVETYGNAWPPNDPEAWSTYIQAMLTELIKTYGSEQVEQWRYCIGREIGTGGHWRGSQLEFFEHYATTENAIRSVLPNAKVGTHFLWASSKHSFGPDFVKWCKLNNVRYDFMGVSYYPFYNQMKRVDMEHVYKVDFAPIKDIPEWNPSATLEIHEFSLITSMSAKGNSYENASKAHQESFAVMLAKMMYEHDMVNIFRWGTGKNKVAEQTFLTMKGNTYFASSQQGSPTASGNMVDAVFARDSSCQQYNIMVYNYNANPEAKTSEPVHIVTTLPLRPGTQVEYRIATYEQNDLNWSKWKTAGTKAVRKPEDSRLEFSVQLEPFSFKKIEFRAPKVLRRINYVLTNRETGAKMEVEIIGAERDHVICYAKGRRFVIPICSLSEEDMEFLKIWVNEI